MRELVLVSGSGRGLGASIAKSFINSGYMVAINYSKSKEKAEKLKIDIISENQLTNLVSGQNLLF